LILSVLAAEPETPSGAENGAIAEITADRRSIDIAGRERTCGGRLPRGAARIARRANSVILRIRG